MPRILYIVLLVIKQNLIKFNIPTKISRCHRKLNVVNIFLRVNDSKIELLVFKLIQIKK